MSGAVGGFTSWLKLESSEGFTEGVIAVTSLTEALRNLKAEAGNLGSMKLKITIDDGSMSEYKKSQDELRNKEKALRKSGNMPVKFDRTKIPEVAGNIKQHEKEKDTLKKDRDKMLRSIHKETVDTLNYFGTALKWTSGIVIGFGGALGALALKNSKENTDTRTQATGFAMSPIDLYKLNKSGAIFGGGDKSFNQLLTSGRELITQQHLSGNVNSPLLVAIKQAMPKVDIATLSKMKPQEYSETIFNNLLSELRDARTMQNSSNYNTREQGKLKQLNAMAVGDTLGGNDLMTVIVGALNSKIGDVFNLKDLLKIFESGQIVNSKGLEASAEFGQVSGKTISLLQQQYEQFIINLETALIPALRTLNDWLIANKDNIANTISNFIGFIGDVIGFIGGVIDFIIGATTLDLGKMISASKVINNFRDELIFSKENLEKGSRLGTVEKKDGEWSVNLLALAANKVTNPELFKGISPLSKEGLGVVNKNIQGMIDFAMSMVKPEHKEIGTIGIIGSTNNANGSLDQVKKNLIDWLKNNSKILTRPMTPDQNKKDIEGYKYKSSYDINGNTPTDVILNATFNIDHSQGRIYQTIRTQNSNNVSKLNGYNPMGQAIG